MPELTLVSTATADAGLAGFLAELPDTWVHRRAPGQAVTGEVVLVLVDHALEEHAEDALLEAARVGRPVLLLGPTVASQREDSRLLEAVGLVPGLLTAEHEVRVRPGPAGALFAARMGDDVVVRAPLLLIDKVVDDTDVLLVAPWRLQQVPVAVYRPNTRVGAVLLPVDHRQMSRLVHRLVRHASGVQDGPSVRVGMLGFGAVGVEHAHAIAQVDGLQLVAVADRDPTRLQWAAAAAPDVEQVGTAEELLARADVDLVIVSTPPNSHARWALAALEAGHHVLVEKPFCLTVAEADAVIGAAEDRGLLCASYQNRRYDTDYLALKRLVVGGAIGDVFSYASFVGGYGHPCNFWHSDAEVSGGALYDWGSHYLDWMLDLFPQPVRHLSAVAVKRLWLDVTNADHSRLTVTFDDGLEAEFVHSDMAAAPRPKWQVLGTRGAVQGDWVSRSVLTRGPIGTLVEDRLQLAEAPAELTLFTPDGVGGTHRTAISAPPPPAAPIHRQLADRLLSGLPMRVTAQGSRRMVALLEAATRSAARGGALEVPDAG